MNRAYRTFSALLVAVGVIALFVEPTAAQNQEREWITVESFDGQGQKNTRPFTIESSEWRIRWESVGTMQDGMGHIFQLYVQKPSDDLFTEIAANVTNVKRASDTSYLYDSGRFYLQANAANGKWSIEVQVPAE